MDDTQRLPVKIKLFYITASPGINRGRCMNSRSKKVLVTVNISKKEPSQKKITTKSLLVGICQVYSLPTSELADVILYTYSQVSSV